MTNSKAGTPRWLVPALIGAAVVGMVAIALVRQPVQLDPTTPEGTVQEYLQAINDKRYEVAFALLDTDSVAGCRSSDLASAAPRDPFGATFGQPGRDAVEEFEAIGPDPEPAGPGGETAFVDVTLRFGTGGPFGSSWEQYVTFDLTRDDGPWWISGDPWPHFTWGCQENR